MTHIQHEFRVLALGAARAARLERMAEELRDELRAVAEIHALRKRAYSSCATTGGHPPEACRAPLPKRAMERRLAEKLEKKRTRDNYRHYRSTGCRPPHECRAPLRDVESSVDDEVDSDDLSSSDDDKSSTDDFCITFSPKKRTKNSK
jgi:hypothetical protein